jgi:hypothetical protein
MICNRYPSPRLHRKRGQLVIVAVFCACLLLHRCLSKSRWQPTFIYPRWPARRGERMEDSRRASPAGGEKWPVTTGCLYALDVYGAEFLKDVSISRPSARSQPLCHLVRVVASLQLRRLLQNQKLKQLVPALMEAPVSWEQPASRHSIKGLNSRC